MNGGGYGQNLAAYGTTASSLNSVDLATVVAWATTDEWYNSELSAIPWGEDSPSTSGPEFLHATQVIWKGSTQVGCATVSCAAGSIFGSEPSLYTGKFSVLHSSIDLTDAQKKKVCNYGPQGNVLGEFNSELSSPEGLPTIYASIS